MFHEFLKEMMGTMSDKNCVQNILICSQCSLSTHSLKVFEKTACNHTMYENFYFADFSTENSPFPLNMCRKTKFTQNLPQNLKYRHQK